MMAAIGFNPYEFPRIYPTKYVGMNQDKPGHGTQRELFPELEEKLEELRVKSLLPVDSIREVFKPLVLDVPVDYPGQTWTGWIPRRSRADSGPSSPSKIRSTTRWPTSSGSPTTGRRWT
jgi:hypothetical protein